MPRNNRKVVKKNELDVEEIFSAVRLIEEEKGIPQSYMLEKITLALVSAYKKDHEKKDHENVGDNIVVDADPEKGTVRMYLKKDVVETVDNPATEISLTEARSRLPQAMLGDVVRIEVKPSDFGRSAAQIARQVIIQGMREGERNMVYEKFSSKEHEIISGLVNRIDPKGGVSLSISSGGHKCIETEAYLAPGEQVRGETYTARTRLRVYVVEVRNSTRGPQILISRTHPGLVKRLFEIEVPEIYDGTVEVKSIAREAGNRTKMAVWSADPNVDPVGACIGPMRTRINNVIQELRGEKIDIIKWSADPAEYVAAALGPADVISVTPLEDGKSCRVIVPDDQLSLAIGKEGQNARLAAKLTGFKIDIKSSAVLDPAQKFQEENLILDEPDTLDEPEQAEEMDDMETAEQAEDVEKREETDEPM